MTGGGVMAGKTVLVTGTTSGIGLEAARALAAMGGEVALGARDVVRGEAVAEEISGTGGRAKLLPIDMASFASVRAAAERFARAHGKLDVLVNNAGIVLRSRRVTADGHEETWQTNFLSAFLLTRLLLPSLRGSPGPRVVNVSSEAHRSGRIDWGNLELERGYGALKAYANSKLALVLFTRELARRETTIAANALHPGAIATGIWRPAPLLARWILRLVLPAAETGASPVVRLAASPELERVSGRYFDRDREAPPSPAARSDADTRRLWNIAEAETPV
jgi:retinol dehydrogenase 12